jgi:DNA (cytosine-5)-methyltransferase 1
MYRAVHLGRPAAFLLENVPGLQMAQDGKLSGAIVDAFSSLGYRVDSQILLAADYGVPQLRRRVFVVGMRGDATFEWPEAPHLGGWRRDTVELWERRRRELGKRRHLTVSDAIDDLPLIRSGQAGKPEGRYTRHADLSPYAVLMRRGSDAVRDHEARVITDEHRALIEHVPPGGTWRDIPGHLLPDRFRGGMRRTDSTNLLGRLHPRRPAYTMTTQFLNVTCGCYAHPSEDRALSVREAARFQSFPERYVFHGTTNARCLQVGNAVPPLLAHHLAYAVARALGKNARRPPVVRSRFEDDETTETTRRRMVGQRRTGTRPEVHLGEAVRSLGLDFSANVVLDGLRREVDLLFPVARVAVFVDGCFWHGCPDHSRPTKSNTKWWADKIARNRERDAETTGRLEQLGFAVVRVWEHEAPPEAAVKVAEVVRRRIGPVSATDTAAAK